MLRENRGLQLARWLALFCAESPAERWVLPLPRTLALGKHSSTERTSSVEDSLKSKQVSLSYILISALKGAGPERENKVEGIGVFRPSP